MIISDGPKENQNCGTCGTCGTISKIRRKVGDLVGSLAGPKENQKCGTCGTCGTGMKIWRKSWRIGWGPKRIKSVEPVELVEPGKSLWQFLQMTSYRPQPQRKSTVWNLWNHFENSAKSWQFGWGLASSKENQKCGTCGTCGAREISMAISWMTWLRPAMATKKIKSVEPVEPVEPG